MRDGKTHKSRRPPLDEGGWRGMDDATEWQTLPFTSPFASSTVLTTKLWHLDRRWWMHTG